MNDQTILASEKFTVVRREYNVPGVGTVRRDMVIHPGAVLILPVLDDGRIVMIRNYRFALRQELLELPAGTLEPPEPPIDCAARELEEETGYIASELTPLATYVTCPGFCTELMHAFVATGLTKAEQKLEPTEQIRLEILSFEEALELTANGGIIDGKTIAALHLYRHRQARGT